MREHLKAFAVDGAYVVALCLAAWLYGIPAVLCVVVGRFTGAWMAYNKAQTIAVRTIPNSNGD